MRPFDSKAIIFRHTDVSVKYVSKDSGFVGTVNEWFSNEEVRVSKQFCL